MEMLDEFDAMELDDSHAAPDAGAGLEGALEDGLEGAAAEQYGHAGAFAGLDVDHPDPSL
jgi:hypothetical protein